MELKCVAKQLDRLGIKFVVVVISNSRPLQIQNVFISSMAKI